MLSPFLAASTLGGRRGGSLPFLPVEIRQLIWSFCAEEETTIPILWCSVCGAAVLVLRASGHGPTASPRYEYVNTHHMLWSEVPYCAECIGH